MFRGRGIAADPWCGCRQDDLWVLSSAASMREGAGRGKVFDRLNQPWTECARSLWHGPNRDGKCAPSPFPSFPMHAHHLHSAGVYVMHEPKPPSPPPPQGRLS